MSKEFWETRWQNQTIGWDLGEVSPPIASYVNQLINKELKILIPGCGNAYEAEYLHQKGFEQVFIVEISESAIKSFHERYPDFPESHIIHADFFDIDGDYDLILEQTFFCAINPTFRKAYVDQMTNLIKPGGKLVGVLFNAEFDGGPPFGGHKSEYLDLFSESFEIVTMEEAHNSIQPRYGNELFIILKRK